MTLEQAKATVKAINRYHRKNRSFEGGKAFGVDFITWNVCYPHFARVYSEAAKVIMGREGRFMPKF